MLDMCRVSLSCRVRTWFSPGHGGNIWGRENTVTSSVNMWPKVERLEGEGGVATSD